MEGIVKLTCIGFTAPNGDYYNEVLGVTGYGSPYKVGDKILIRTKKERDEDEKRYQAAMQKAKELQEWWQDRTNGGKNDHREPRVI